MEVLSPAGSKDALRAALRGGADAVYLGGKMFGARRFAQNFSDGELRAAVRACHQQGMKVYATVNTLIKEDELSIVASHIDMLSSIDMDAVIVQDRGLLRMIKERTDMSVHASTQMGVHSPEDAQWAENYGMDRAILSRELTLEEVKKIRCATHIGLEVFVHGALCYCFSGQCLFSSLLGGRVGNRGMCAQPCRKRYAMKGNEAFFLSTADLFSIGAIPDLLKVGIDSIKIEGRLRSPTYVYLATLTYKKAVEQCDQWPG